MVLGIEFGSTRIKSVLIDDEGNFICSSSHEWHDKLVDKYWSYSLDDVWIGVQHCYSSLNKVYFDLYGKNIEKLSAIGVSAMMHGYLAFDENDEQVVPFRTWRNTNTEVASEELSEKFRFNMPQRWSATHYYQAVLDGEEHVSRVSYLTTLAGYVHWRLTGRKVLGIGDASGMFPLKDDNYDSDKLKIFNDLLCKHNCNKDFESLLPEILKAGQIGGRLTSEGARLLDIKGNLKEGAILCPPEGDAQTGMIATNSIKEKTGNVSAGTSAFAMVVLSHQLNNYYKEIDITATPDGCPVAMIHANNCTSELNNWVNLFDEVIKLMGFNSDKNKLYEQLFKKSEESNENVGNIFVCNFFSGEPVVGIKKGIPMIIYPAGENFNLSNFMASEIYSAIAPLHEGIKILEKENVEIEQMCGHGGYFKTQIIGQKAMSAALNAPVTVFENAGEGGAFGIALLALYCFNGKDTLEEFLNEYYKNYKKFTIMADFNDKVKFNNFMKNYRKGLKVEQLAGEEYNA